MATIIQGEASPWSKLISIIIIDQTVFWLPSTNAKVLWQSYIRAAWISKVEPMWLKWRSKSTIICSNWHTQSICVNRIGWLESFNVEKHEQSKGGVRWLMAYIRQDLSLLQLTRLYILHLFFNDNMIQTLNLVVERQWAFSSGLVTLLLSIGWSDTLDWINSNTERDGQIQSVWQDSKSMTSLLL